MRRILTSRLLIEHTYTYMVVRTPKIGLFKLTNQQPISSILKSKILKQFGHTKLASVKTYRLSWVLLGIKS